MKAGGTNFEFAGVAEENERQSKLLYSLIVAGKSANFTDAVVYRFMRCLADYSGVAYAALARTEKTLPYMLPFDSLRRLRPQEIETLLRISRTGNYTKLSKAIPQILKANFDLSTVTPQQLETIHGIGPKTARFFVLWTRPDEVYAALDVHVLRWLQGLGYPAPKSTPSGKKYEMWEAVFIGEAVLRGKTPRELDREIWEAGAGRTQENATV